MEYLPAKKLSGVTCTRRWAFFFLHGQIRNEWNSTWQKHLIIQSGIFKSTRTLQLHKQMNIDFGYISCSRMYWRTRYKEISIQLLNLTWTWGAWNDLDPFIVFISLIFNLDNSGVWLFGYFFRPHLHSFGKAKKICKKSAVFLLSTQLLLYVMSLLSTSLLGTSLS